MGKSTLSHDQHETKMAREAQKQVRQERTQKGRIEKMPRLAKLRLNLLRVVCAVEWVRRGSPLVLIAMVFLEWQKLKTKGRK